MSELAARILDNGRLNVHSRIKTRSDSTIRNLLVLERTTLRFPMQDGSQ